MQNLYRSQTQKVDHLLWVTWETTLPNLKGQTFGYVQDDEPQICQVFSWWFQPVSHRDETKISSYHPDIHD